MRSNWNSKVRVTGVYNTVAKVTMDPYNDCDIVINISHLFQYTPQYTIQCITSSKYQHIKLSEYTHNSYIW